MPASIFSMLRDCRRRTASGIGQGFMPFLAMLHFNGEVHQLVMLTKPFAENIRIFRFVRYDRDDGGKLADADLPDVQVAHERIAVALDRPANFIWQIAASGCAIE